MLINGTADATRFNSALASETLTVAHSLTATSAYWQRLSAASAQDVYLPDDAALPDGQAWGVVIENAGTATLAIKAADGTAVKTLEAGGSTQIWWNGTAWAVGAAGAAAAAEIPSALYVPNYWSYR